MTQFDPKTSPWQVSENDFPGNGTMKEKMTHLLGYAILAPSSHNTQPWKFQINDSDISVYADKDRWLKVADADQRELYISIGCALENLAIAGEYFGYSANTQYFPRHDDNEPVATISFSPAETEVSGKTSVLFKSIPKRHTSHKPFEDKEVPEKVQKELENCATENGIYLDLTSDSKIKRKVDELISKGDAMQFADPAWREELGEWIGKGVFGTSWLMSKIGQLAITYLNMSRQTAKKDSELLMSAPMIGVISSEEDNREIRVKAGRIFQRMSLLAADNDIYAHPMSQVVEVGELKSEIAGLIPRENVIPQHTFRIGYCEPEKEHTPRRPLKDVMNG